MAVTKEEVADAMYELVSEYQGKKKLKAGDLIKMMIQKYGEDQVDKKLCKAAIRILMDSGRCVYTYFGGSFIEIPHEEGAADGAMFALRSRARGVCVAHQATNYVSREVTNGGEEGKKEKEKIRG